MLWFLRWMKDWRKSRLKQGRDRTWFGARLNWCNGFNLNHCKGQRQGTKNTQDWSNWILDLLVQHFVTSFVCERCCINAFFLLGSAFLSWPTRLRFFWGEFDCDRHKSNSNRHVLDETFSKWTRAKKKIIRFWELSGYFFYFLVSLSTKSTFLLADKLNLGV